MALNDYMSDGGESTSRKVSQPVIRKVLECIASKKASYSSEIQNVKRLDRQDVNYVLYTLKSAGIIESVKPRWKNNDDRLIDRRQDMRDKGITGMNPNTGQMQSINWFALNSDLSWRLKVDGADLWVDEFHNPIKEFKTDSVMDFAMQEVNKVD